MAKKKQTYTPDEEKYNDMYDGRAKNGKSREEVIEGDLEKRMKNAQYAEDYAEIESIATRVQNAYTNSMGRNMANSTEIGADQAKQANERQKRMGNSLSRLDDIIGRASEKEVKAAPRTIEYQIDRLAEKYTIPLKKLDLTPENKMLLCNGALDVLNKDYSQETDLFIIDANGNVMMNENNPHFESLIRAQAILNVFGVDLNNEYEAGKRYITSDAAVKTEDAQDYSDMMISYGKEAVQSGRNGTYIKHDTDYGDPNSITYEWLNKWHLGNKSIDLREELKYCSEGERRLFNTLYATDPQKAIDFLTELNPYLEERALAASIERTRKAIEKGGLSAFWENVKSVGRNALLSPFAVLENLQEASWNLISGEESDGYTGPIMRQLMISDAARAATSEDWHPALQYLYGGAMSQLDSIVASGFGASGVAGAINMGSNAMAHTMADVQERGGGTGEQLLLGGIAGLAEFSTSKMGIDRLFGGNSGGIVKTLAKNAGSEFTEELATAAINNTADYVVMGENSNYSLMVESYMKEKGMSENEAKAAAAKTMGTNDFLEALSAGFVGTVGSGVGVTVSAVSHNNYVTNLGATMKQSPVAIQNVVDFGKQIKNPLASNIDVDTASDKAVGKMVEAVVSDGIKKDGSIRNLARMVQLVEGRPTGGAATDTDMRTASAIAAYVLHGKSDTAVNIIGKSGGGGVVFDAILQNSSVKNSIKTALNPNAIGQEMKDLGIVEDIIRDGLESPEGSESYKLAQKFESKGIENLTAKEVGKLYLANIEQAVTEGNWNLRDENASASKEDTARGAFMLSAGSKLISNPVAAQRVINLGKEMKNADVKSIAEKISRGEQPTSAEMGRMIESVASEAIEKDGGMVGVIKMIHALEGRESSYIGSRESIQTAQAVMAVLNGTATQAEFDIISRSPGALTVLSALQSNKDLWRDSSATQSSAQNDKADSGERKPSTKTDTKKAPSGKKDTDTKTTGRKGEGIRTAGLVMNEASRKLDEGVRTNIQTFAKRTGSTVILEHGLVDENGEVIMGEEKDGVIRINADYADVAHSIAVHEFTHLMKKIASNAYTEFENYVVSKMKNEGTYEGAIAKLREDYSGLSDEKLVDELCAETAERLFRDEAELTGFIKKDRTLAERVKDAWLKVLDMLGRTDERTHAQLMWKKCVKEATSSNNKDVETGEVRYKKANDTNDTYDYSKTFAQQLKDFIAGKIPENDTLIVGETPDVFKKIGFNALPVTINQKHVDYAINGTKDSDHHIGITTLKQLPEALKRPVAIIKSDTNPGRVTALLGFIHNGSRVIAPIEIDGFGTQNNISIDSNAITSVYAKTEGIRKLRKAIRDEANGNISIFYWDKKRSLALLRTPGHQLPNHSPQDGFIHSIREKGAKINIEFKNVTETQQFKRWFGKSKVVNADGTPKLMYRGDNNMDFTVFDRKKSKYSNLYGRGFYFTESESAANTYGEVHSFYLKVDNPLTPGNNKITKSQLRRFLEAVAENEDDYDIWNYGTSDINEIMNSLKGKGDFEVIQDISATAIGDMVEAVELFNSVNGTKYDGIVTETETVVFNSTQIKSATDNIGTFDGNNPDIRYKRPGVSEKLDEYIGDFGEAVKSADVKSLQEENAELRKQLENVSLFNISRSAGLGAEIRRAAMDLKSGYGSKIGVSTLQKELNELYNYMTGKDTRNDPEVARRIHNLAERVIAQSTETVVNEEYSDLLERIKTARIHVPESERADFRDGYEHFRKHDAMGKITLTNDGIELDVLWKELCEEYPNLFDEDVTGAEERLEKILEVREEFAPAEESIYHTDKEYRSAVLSLANDVMESFYRIPESDGGNKFVFYGKNAPMKQKALEESKDRATARKISWNKSEVKKTIDSDYRYLSRMVNDPTDARHVPEDMRASVAYLLDCFDFETVQLDRLREEGKEADSPTAVRLSKMYDAYGDIIRKAWGIDSGTDESKLLDEHLTADLQELRNEIPIDESGEFKRIQDMSIEELRSVAKVLKSIHHVITQRNKAFNSAVKEEISELGEASVFDMRKVRDGRKGSGEKLDYETNAINKAVKLLDDYFNIDNIQPWDFFHGMGGTMERLYMEERKAFDRHIDNIHEASDVLQKATKGIDLKRLTGKNAEKIWFKLESGEQVRISKGQVLSLYALYQRQQGKDHILGGGIVINAEARNSSGQKTSPNSAHHITETDLGKLFENLSDDEKRMVRDVVEFLSKRCSAWGNETSMRLYGYEKFGEGWYFPIKVSNQTLNTYYGEKGEGSLRSQSFTKKTVKNAQNAVEVGDFFDVVTSHINGISLYNTVALPMLDLERVLNYNDKDIEARVREEVIKTFGKSAEQYIETFHKDVNGSRKTNDSDTVLEKLSGNAKRASIGMNLRVLFQQPTSVARALLFINPVDFRSIQSGISLKREMQENIPIAYWKSLGFRDIGTGGTMKEVLLNNESLYSKAAMGLYGMADDFTWAWIYGAVKNEVARKNPKLDRNSAEFKEKVKERFNYIVDRSQVVDSVFHRTQSMRSTNFFTKNATMFMSEPLKTYNMYRTELMDAVREGKKAKTFARATAAFVVSNILLSFAQALPDAWREGDDKELYGKDGKYIGYWARVLRNANANFKDNVNPITYLPYLKDIDSMIKGFSQERIEYSNLADFIAAIQNFDDAKKSLPNRIVNLLKPVSALFGMSYGNLYRDAIGLGSIIYRATGDEYNEYTLTKLTWDVENPENKSKFMKWYERAIQNDHSEEAAAILEDYLSSVYSGEDFDNKHIKKVVAETTKLYGKTDSDSKLLYSIPEEKFSNDGNKYSIQSKDYPLYVSDTYNTMWDLAYELITSEEYKSMTDEDKVRAFGEIKNYSQHAERADRFGDYELDGWMEKVYKGEMSYVDSATERAEERVYQAERKEYKDEFEYDESLYTESEIGVIEDVESDAASYYASIEQGKEYNEKTLRHIKVYDEKLSDDMTIEEYAGHRAKAKKEAALADGKPNMKKDELKAYLDSTDYSIEIKRALFEAIGNSNWKNPY